MGVDELTYSGLQSGIVLAVIIAAVLFADRLGGGAALAQRAAQVALGLALMLAVFSATTAFHPPSTVPSTELESVFEAAFESQDTAAMDRLRQPAQRDSEVGTIHIGLGIILVVLGIALFSALRVITPGVLLGGVLLILLGAPATDQGGGLDQFNVALTLLNNAIPGILSDAGYARDIARFAVLLAGVILLGGAMYFKWERQPAADAGVADDAEDASGS